MKKTFLTLFTALFTCGWLALRAQETTEITPEEAVDSLRSLLTPLMIDASELEENDDEIIAATMADDEDDETGEDDEIIATTAGDDDDETDEDDGDTFVFNVGATSDENDDNTLQAIQDQADKAIQVIEDKADEASAAIDAKVDAASAAIKDKVEAANAAIEGKADEASAAIEGKVDAASAAIDAKVDAGTLAIDEATAKGNETIENKVNAASNALVDQATLIQQQLSEQYTLTVEQQQQAEEAKQEAEQKIGELDGLLTNRKRIAMIPFACAQPTFTAGNENIIATSISDALLSDFNQFFLQSPRFRVVSRQDDAVVDNELARIINNATASGNFNELYKVGMELNLDYVLVGSVKQFFIAPPQVNTVQLTGAHYASVARAVMELDYRIVNIATKEIIWADHIFIDLTPAEIKDAGNDIVTLYQTLNQMASRRIAEAMDAIEPIRVVKILPNGQFVLDRAGNLIIPGSFFDVYRQGDPILDPSTGEELGRPEELLSTIQIKRVDPKLSYGEIVLGSGVITPSDVASGIIVRPHREPVYVTPQETPATPPVIMLPMDF
ncbi:MAG: hypothetical protein II943_02650 [Victivallales bacterium]|nr:hypothetical protein [Victivallales bacterium]